jgi:hypothetical protein
MQKPSRSNPREGPSDLGAPSALSVWNLCFDFCVQVDLNVAQNASDRFNEHPKGAIKPCAIAAHAGTVMTGPSNEKPQLLHLVFGGELKSLDRMEFANLDALDIVGIYPNYAAAHAAWKGVAQRTVDNAQMRYFIVHLHRLLDPDTTAKKP